MAQSARQAPWNDCAHLPELVSQAHAHTPVGCVLADAEFDSERNHTFVRRQLHALSVIPAKRGKKTWCIHGVRAEMRNHFPRQKYSRRALIETVLPLISPAYDDSSSDEQSIRKHWISYFAALNEH